MSEIDPHKVIFRNIIDKDCLPVSIDELKGIMAYLSPSYVSYICTSIMQMHILFIHALLMIL